MFSPRTIISARRTISIKPLWIKRLVAGCTILSGAAYAAGFGEIMLHSRIGENLLAEVPLVTGGKEINDAGCFSLLPMPGADLPVISNARIRLVNNGNNPRLVIIGSKPLNEPISTISLHAACGIDLQRDFILMPEAPTSPVEVADSRILAPTYRPLPSANNNSVRRLAEGFSDPDTAAQPVRKAVRKKSDNRPSNASIMPRPERLVSVSPAQTGDRLMLGTAPADLKSQVESLPPTAAGNPIEERLLKMETSLHSLNQELDTLNASLTLSTEMLAAKHELQVAQSLQSASITTATAAPEPIQQQRASWSNWLELVISAWIGGSIAAGIATYLGRRKKQPLLLNRVVDINKFAIKAKASRKMPR